MYDIETKTNTDWVAFIKENPLITDLEGLQVFLPVDINVPRTDKEPHMLSGVALSDDGFLYLLTKIRLRGKDNIQKEILQPSGKSQVNSFPNMSIRNGSNFSSNNTLVSLAGLSKKTREKFMSLLDQDILEACWVVNSMVQTTPTIGQVLPEKPEPSMVLPIMLYNTIMAEGNLVLKNRRLQMAQTTPSMVLFWNEPIVENSNQIMLSLCDTSTQLFPILSDLTSIKPVTWKAFSAIKPDPEWEPLQVGGRDVQRHVTILKAIQLVDFAPVSWLPKTNRQWNNAVHLSKALSNIMPHPVVDGKKHPITISNGISDLEIKGSIMRDTLSRSGQQYLEEDYLARCLPGVEHLKDASEAFVIEVLSSISSNDFMLDNLRKTLNGYDQESFTYLLLCGRSLAKACEISEKHLQWTIEQARAKLAAQPEMAPDSPLGNNHEWHFLHSGEPFKIEGHDITFRELLSNADLNQEGVTMDHCVGSYSYLAKKGQCHILSLTDPEGKRSTVELTLEQKPEKNLIVRVRQNMGPENARPDDNLIRAGTSLAFQLQNETLVLNATRVRDMNPTHQEDYSRRFIHNNREWFSERLGKDFDGKEARMERWERWKGWLGVKDAKPLEFLKRLPQALWQVNSNLGIAGGLVGHWLKEEQRQIENTTKKEHHRLLREERENAKVLAQEGGLKL